MRWLAKAIAREAGLTARHNEDEEFAATRAQLASADGRAAWLVAYKGVLPDLFREGQGVVVEGSLLPDGTFKANEVLAKHDEKYMPPEVVAALKKSGRWQEAGP